jgi:hypothetical protein
MIVLEPEKAWKHILDIQFLHQYSMPSASVGSASRDSTEERKKTIFLNAYILKMYNVIFLKI